METKDINDLLPFEPSYRDDVFMQMKTLRDFVEMSKNLNFLNEQKNQIKIKIEKYKNKTALNPRMANEYRSLIYRHDVIHRREKRMQEQVESLQKAVLQNIEKEKAKL